MELVSIAIKNESTEQLLVIYQELELQLQYGELVDDDNIVYVECYQELKRRGVRI